MTAQHPFKVPFNAASFNFTASKLSLALLGPPQVATFNDELVSFESDKSLALLVYLAIEHDRPHRRAALAAMFWPDHPRRKALVNLRQTLARLRRAISDDQACPPFLDVTSQTIQFNLTDRDYAASSVWLDVIEFESLIQRVLSHHHRRIEACRSCQPLLTSAVNLVKDDFLAGFFLDCSYAFEEWLLIERERLRQKTILALEALSELMLAQGDFVQAITYAERLLKMDPLNENALRKLLQAFALDGKRNAALQRFRLFTKNLQTNLHIPPEDATIKLVQQIQSERLKKKQISLPALYKNPTPFVGQESALSALEDALTSNQPRLITIFGAGGSGKTCLALQTATAEANLWEDGIYFVQADEAQNAEQLLERITCALPLTLLENRPVFTQLCRFLEQKELLLILDGFDHLTAESHLIVKLLACTSHLKILITSRQRLNVPGEWIIQLNGLELPPPAPLPDSPDYFQAHQQWLKAVESNPAIQLFIQSAQQAHPNFRLQTDQRQATANLCRLVDGLPSGIKLAASWAALLTPEEIADKLNHDLAFRTKDWQNLPSRQISLQASFDYSWSLLNETQRRFLRRLSIFPGHFQREAAEAITGVQLTDIIALVDRSLLNVSSQGLIEMPSLLRRYAAGKTPETVQHHTALQLSYAEYYLQRVSQLEPALSGPEQKKTLQTFNCDLVHFLHAWRWAVMERQVALLDIALSGLYAIFMVQGRQIEGVRLFKDALDNIFSAAPINPKKTTKAIENKLYHRLRCRVAALSLTSGQNTLAVTDLNLSVRYFASVNDNLELAFVLNVLALKTLWDGNLTNASTAIQQTLALYDQLNLPANKASAQLSQGLIWEIQGDYLQASTSYQASLDYARSQDNLWMMANALLASSSIDRLRHNYRSAWRLAKMALEVYQELNDRRGIASCNVILGLIVLEQGNYTQAIEILELALHEGQRLGNREIMAHCLSHLGHAYTARKQREPAAHAFSQAIRLSLGLQNQRLILNVLVDLAKHMLQDGRSKQAMHILEVVQAHPASDYQARSTANWLSHAAVSASNGQPENRSRLDELAHQAIAYACR